MSDENKEKRVKIKIDPNVPTFKFNVLTGTTECILYFTPSGSVYFKYNDIEGNNTELQAYFDVDDQIWKFR